MDFNDIQNAWNNEKTDNVVIPDNLEKIQLVNTPLDKIKRNLKREFKYQIVCIALLGFIPLVYDFPRKWTFCFTCFLVYMSLFVPIIWRNFISFIKD